MTSSSTPYTVLYVRVQTDGTRNWQIRCGSGGPLVAAGIYDQNNNVANELWVSKPCSADLYWYNTDDADFQLVSTVTYVNYDLSAVTSSGGGGTTTVNFNASSSVPYGDWLFVNAFILFCLAFIPITALFSFLLKKKK